jgi:hypothetical protein
MVNSKAYWAFGCQESTIFIDDLSVFGLNCSTQIEF